MSAFAHLALWLALAAQPAPVSLVPFGEKGKVVESGAVAPVRARVSIKSAPNHPVPVVELGKPVEISYEVKNEGKTDLSLWHAGFWPNHLIEVQHAVSGADLPASKWGAQVRSAFSPQGPRDKNVQWKLSPGQIDSSEGSYDLARLFDLSQPGYYRVRVRYQEEILVESNVLLFYVLPPHVVALLDKLNGWDREECDRSERPEAHPGFVASGETNGFVGTYKGELMKAGVDVVWQPDWKLYVVTDSALTPDRVLIPGDAQRCQTSQECALVPAGCCACAAGGTNVAALKRNLAAIDQRRRERCARSGCTTKSSNHPSCAAKGAACVGGWCVPER